MVGLQRRAVVRVHGDACDGSPDLLSVCRVTFHAKALGRAQRLDHADVAALFQGDREDNRVDAVGDRWFVDETYVKVAGVWRYVHRAVDQHGQVIDVYVSRRRDIAAARTFFTAALTVHGDPGEVITDRSPALANVVEDLLPAALHNTGQYENNSVECDHGRLKARLRPMRGLKTNRTTNVVIRGHAFMQNLRRGHYELAVDATPVFRLATAFDELRPAI